jgi:hypothetical protein
MEDKYATNIQNMEDKYATNIQNMEDKYATKLKNPATTLLLKNVENYLRA